MKARRTDLRDGHIHVDRLEEATRRLPRARNSPLKTTEAKKLTREAVVYTMVEDHLYRKGLHTPMLKCLNMSESKYVLVEIHGGINGQHMGAKALARKALRAGYYWPTMEADSKEFVKTCDSCQKHARIIWSPPSDKEYISAP
ncbi:hypothetical protein K1719_008914 [Acacia pycnantha]|nr:hypothetical protein K1719_008914 [Acacia pycnantha]